MFGFALFAGLTMVTNVPFYSFKDISMKKSVPFVVIVLIALGIAVINIYPPAVLFAIFVVYGVSGYALYFWRKSRGERASMVFLDSAGKLSRIGDAERVRKWIETHSPNGLPSGNTIIRQVNG